MQEGSEDEPGQGSEQGKGKGEDGGSESIRTTTPPEVCWKVARPGPRATQLS